MYFAICCEPAGWGEDFQCHRLNTIQHPVWNGPRLLPQWQEHLTPSRKKTILVSSLREAAQSSQRVKLAAFKLCVICFDLSSVAYKLHVGGFVFIFWLVEFSTYLNLRAGSKCLKGCFIIFISSSFVKEKKTSSYFLWFYPTTHDNKHRPQKKFSARSLDTYHPQLPFFINITMLPVNQ